LFEDATQLVTSGRFFDLNEALLHLWELYLEFWRARGKPSNDPVFTQNTLCWSSHADFPTLVQKIKGANSKRILIWALHRCVDVARADGASEVQKDMACMAHHLSSYIELCDTCGLFFTEGQAQEAQNHGSKFLLWWQYFAHTAVGEQRCAHKLRPKLHYFAHTVKELTDCRENPAKKALWGAEDLVGQVKKIGKHCSKRTVNKRVAQRRALGVAMRAKFRGWRGKTAQQPTRAQKTSLFVIS